MLATRPEFIAFGNRVKDHWKELVGGSVVFLIIGYALNLGLDIPKADLVLAVFFAAIAWASFLAWRDEHRDKNKLQNDLNCISQSASKKRQEARENMFQSCMDMLKKQSPIFSFHVVVRHKAYNLADKR